MTRSRLILTSLVGSIALISLSLSLSLAWYASGDRLSIESLDMNIVSDPLLKVSTSSDLSTFVDELDLNSAELDEGNQQFLFTPASSMYREDWLNDETELPAFYDSSFVESVGTVTKQEVKKGFYQKKIYLLTDTNRYVGLDIEQSLFENDEATNAVRAEEFYKSNDNKELQFSVDQIREKLSKLINCLRVSILINDVSENDLAKIDNNRFYIINPTKEENEKVYFGGLLDNDNDGYFDTYEDTNENGLIQREVIYGDVNDRSLISYKDPEIPGYEDEDLEKAQRFIGNSFTGKHKKGAYTFDEEASSLKHLEFKEEGALSVEEIGSQLKIPCYGGQPREIVLSIYLEGWDLDCINATMGASFNTRLSFKLLGGII